LFSPEIFGKMEKTFWKAHFFMKEDSMKIAVIGATGTIGSKIAAELEKRGHEVVPISRSHGVDVSSLADLSAALTGVDVVIDAINNMIMSSKKAQTAFISTSSNIAQAAADNDVKRIVMKPTSQSSQQPVTINVNDAKVDLRKPSESIPYSELMQGSSSSKDNDDDTSLTTTGEA